MMPAFIDYLLELFAPLATTAGPVRARRLFDGYGIYCDGVMFALVSGDRVYLKTDTSSVSQFEAEGCTPFTYRLRDRQVSTSYWSVPDVCLDGPSPMTPWARLAFAAALRQANAKATSGRKKRP